MFRRKRKLRHSPSYVFILYQFVFEITAKENDIFFFMR